MEFSYKTVKFPVENILLKEKGSKFISFLFPVHHEKELRAALDKIRAEHPKATHHCYAFRMGISGENYRANDDGEPNGSAGLPIYNQLLANELTNILLIVVRYYGGTKLGVSGLVKAYKDSAKLILEEAEIITKDLEVTLEIDFEFSHQNPIFTLINKFQGKIIDFTSEERCTIIAQIKLAEKENISEQLSEMQNISYQFFPLR